MDLKSGNIFLGEGNDKNYIVKIGDFRQAAFDFNQFSLSQATSNPSQKSEADQTRARVGTAPFTAPELIDIGATKSTKTDVYSFSMLLVEFTLPERSHPWEGEVSSCDLIYHYVKKGKDLLLTPRDSNNSLTEKVSNGLK